MTPLAFSRTIASCISIAERERERNALPLSLVRRLERHALNAGHLRLCEREDTNDGSTRSLTDVNPAQLQ